MGSEIRLAELRWRKSTLNLSLVTPEQNSGNESAKLDQMAALGFKSDN